MTIWLILKAFFSRALSFIADNWRWLLPLAAGLLLWWYISHLQASRDDAIKALADFKQQIATAADAQRAANAKKETAAVQLSTDIQKGATSAIQSVYDYYGKHPRIVYRDGLCQPAGSGAGGMPAAAETSGDHPADTADDGHASAGTSIPIQVIEPDLVPRCADTTIQALECKKYVEGLRELLSE